MENGSAASAGLSDSEQQQQQRRNTSQLDRRHVVEKVQQQHDPLRRGNSSPRGLGASASSGSGTAGAQPTTTTASAANSATMATATTTTTTTTSTTANASAYTTTMNGANAGMGNSDMPSTMKLLSELERSWAMFSASWKVVDLFGGMQIYQQQTVESQTEPLNGMLLSTSSAGLVAFLAGSIGGGGIITAVLLTLLVVFGALWTMTANRVRGQVPSFKNMRVVDGTPSEIFLYLMNVKTYPIWDASVERAEVVHTIDDHSDIIHIVYRPVWMWPIWVTPRDLCLLRYWRRAEDGSYVICLQSAIHPECPPTHDIIRAKCNGGGFTISPRGAGLAQSDEFTSMVTNVIHLDPQGWEGKLLQRLGNMHVYLRPQILALTGLQEVMEARKYVCPNVPEEFSAAMASAEDASAAIAAEQQGENGAGGVANEGETVVPLQEFPCNVPRSMWAEPDGSAMLVRGPDYLTDRRKIPSAPPAFRLMGVDVFNSSKAIEHIASRPDNIVQKEIKRHEAQGTEMPFTFVINFVVPGNPRINMVLYYQAPNPSILKEGTAFGDLMSDFLDGTDDFRDERFKLIPCIVEGSFIVRQAVGSTPAIIGKKLRQPCYRGEKYFELDVDIGSSAVANRVVGLVSGYTKKLVIDMGFLIEGQRHDELPERLFGSVRLLYIDLSIATKLD